MKKFTTKPVRTTILTIAIACMLFVIPLNVGIVYAQATVMTKFTNEVTSLPEPSKKNTRAHLSYDITAKLNTDDMTIIGNQTVTYRNTSTDPLHDVVFRLLANAYRSQETLQSLPSFVRRENKRVAEEFPHKKPEDFLGGIDIISAKDAVTGHTLAMTNEGQALTVKLAKALHKDEEITLQLAYKTKIPFGLRRLSYYKDIIHGAYWFPSVSIYNEQTHTWNKAPYTKFETDYNEVANYKVSLDVPEKLQVILPGQVSEQPAEAGRKLVTTNMEKTRELVFFASEKFRKASQTKNGLTI